MLQKMEKQRRLFDITFTVMTFLIILQALFLRRGNTRNVVRRRKPTNDKTEWKTKARVYTYPDILNPQLFHFGFKNFPVHT